MEDWDKDGADRKDQGENHLLRSIAVPLAPGSGENLPLDLHGLGRII